VGGLLDLTGSRQRQVIGSLEHNNEPSSSAGCGEFLDWPRNCWVFKEV
jgi:hypothetical protein